MSSNPASSLHHRQQQLHSTRTKLLRGRGLVAQVFPIEMQTLWYGNWQLQKPARIHTSMHWNHLRNVRWDGTSSQDKIDKWTKPAGLGRVRDGFEVQRERERERGWRGRQQNICPPSAFEFLPSKHLFPETAWAVWWSATSTFTSATPLPVWEDVTFSSSGITDGYVSIKHPSA